MASVYSEFSLPSVHFEAEAEAEVESESAGRSSESSVIVLPIHAYCLLLASCSSQKQLSLADLRPVSWQDSELKFETRELSGWNNVHLAP